MNLLSHIKRHTYFFLQNNYLYEEDPSEGKTEENNFALQST